MLKALKQYLPFFGMVLVAVLQVAQVAFEDSVLTPDEMFTVALAFLGAMLTYVVPRLPGALAWLKTALSAAVAAVTVLATAYVGGLSSSDYVNIALAFLGTLGVAVTTKYVPETVPVENNVVEGPVVPDAEGGESAISLLIGVLVIVVLVILALRLV